MRINALVSLQDVTLVLREWLRAVPAEHFNVLTPIGPTSGAVIVQAWNHVLTNGTATVILPEPSAADLGKGVWIRKTTGHPVTVRTTEISAKVNGATSVTMTTSSGTWLLGGLSTGWWSHA